MSGKHQDIISNLRAIITSCKGGLPLVDVQNDYSEAFGEKVPVREMGYTSMRDLFEKNPSEFYIFCDKVDVVTKANSAHARSLASSQKGGKGQGGARNFANTKDPKKKYILPYMPPRANRENNLSTPKENPQRQVDIDPPRKVIDPTETVTLRKPRTTSELAQPPLRVGAPQGKTENTKKMNFTVTAKTDTNTREEKPRSSTAADLGTTPQYKDTFENIKDLPVGITTQPRAWWQKTKVSQDLRSPNTDEAAAAKPSEPTEIFFDTKSISSAPPSLLRFNEPAESQKEFLSKYTNQKAQARIAQLQQSMQKLVKSMNIPPNEVNNNRMNNSNLRTESSTDQPSIPKFSFEKSTDRELPMDRSEITRSQVSARFSHPSQDKKLSLSDNSMYVEQLNKLCKSRGFQDPVYKIIVRDSESGRKHFICKVEIEDHLKMSSYPVETQDPISAKELAAKKTYNYCITDESFRKDTTEKILIQRILKLVNTGYCVWSENLPNFYYDMYEEEICKNWLDIVSKSPLLEIETIDDKHIVIRKKTERSVEEVEILQKLKHLKITGSGSQLPDLKLPNAAHWEIYITNITSSDEVWCRLIGEKYSDAYDTVMNKMELNPPKRKAENPKIGGYYIASASAGWYRVRLIEWINESQLLIFYIDTGDREIVSLEDLYEPDDNYFSLAPQAIAFSLFELGCFSEDEELVALLVNTLHANSFIGEIITEMDGSENSGERLIRLWDTSTDRDINVNQVLLNNIIKEIGPPTLPSTSQIKEVIVTSVSDSGEIHVQTNELSVNRLNCLIRNKMKSVEEENTQRRIGETIGTDTLYLSRCPRTGNFCRVKLIEIQNLNVVDVLFIDYGFVQRKEVSELIHLEKSSILQAIPAQAIKVRLGNVLFLNKNAIAELRQTILNENVLLKVITNDSDGLSSIEFFKRSSAGKALYSVNMKIKNDPEFKDFEVPVRRKSVVVGLEKVMPKTLPAPELPEIGQHFEVFVTLASSPDLFIVQPLSTRPQLMRMMNELQLLFTERYSPMRVQTDIIIGELYAVLHPDGNWYRGCAQAVIGSYNYSVYMCDFGDCLMVTKDKLMPLPEKFKTFPYQAIRATLFGIPQQLRDWTPFDCITFHKLVVEKYFVSTVLGITRNEKNPNYISLGLILTDTSGNDDVYIHKILLEKKNDCLALMSI